MNDEALTTNNEGEGIRLWAIGGAWAGESGVRGRNKRSQNEAKFGWNFGGCRAGWIPKRPVFTGRCGVFGGIGVQGDDCGEITERSHRGQPNGEWPLRTDPMPDRQDRQPIKKHQTPTRRIGGPSRTGKRSGNGHAGYLRTATAARAPSAKATATGRDSVHLGRRLAGERLFR